MENEKHCTEMRLVSAAPAVFPPLRLTFSPFSATIALCAAEKGVFMIPFTGSVCSDNCIFRRERLSSADKPCVIAEACRVLVACKECTEPFSK